MRSETCRGERILYDFNVFFNKYLHELVTIDTNFIDARFNYENYIVYLFLEKCSTCFEWYLHPSSGAHTLYLQYLVLVKPLLLPADTVEELEPFLVWCGNCTDLFWCGCNRTQTELTMNRRAISQSEMEKLSWMMQISCFHCSVGNNLWQTMQ